MDPSSWRELLGIMISSATEKAFHMIRWQRASAASAVETLNTFNLSTTKTEASVTKSGGVESVCVCVFLMDSTHEGRDIGMEQWRITHLPATTMFSSTHTTHTPEAVFKKFCILFRSLETLLHVLPTHRLIKRSRQGEYASHFQCVLQEHPNATFGEGRDYVFSKISTPVGDFSLSVRYRVSCPMSLLKPRALTDFIVNRGRDDVSYSEFAEFFHTPGSSQPSSSAQSSATPSQYTPTPIVTPSAPAPIVTRVPPPSPVINIHIDPSRPIVFADPLPPSPSLPSSSPSPSPSPLSPIAASPLPMKSSPMAIASPSSSSYSSSSSSPISSSSSKGMPIPSPSQHSSKPIAISRSRNAQDTTPSDSAFSPSSMSIISASIGQSPVFLITEYDPDIYKRSCPESVTSRPGVSPPFEIVKQPISAHSPSYSSATWLSSSFSRGCISSNLGDGQSRPRNSAPFFLSMEHVSQSPQTSSEEHSEEEDIDYPFASDEGDEASLSDFLHFLEHAPPLSPQSSPLNVDFCVKELSRMTKYLSH